MWGNDSLTYIVSEQLINLTLISGSWYPKWICVVIQLKLLRYTVESSTGKVIEAVARRCSVKKVFLKISQS